MIMVKEEAVLHILLTQTSRSQLQQTNKRLLYIRRLRRALTKEVKRVEIIIQSTYNLGK